MKVWCDLLVGVTCFIGAERYRREVAIGHAGLPGGTAASTPDAADPRPGFHTPLLCHEGLAAGWPVHEHVIEQDTGKAPKHIHRPDRENRALHLIIHQDNQHKQVSQAKAKAALLKTFH